jgi:hypothetical protein
LVKAPDFQFTLRLEGSGEQRLQAPRDNASLESGFILHPTPINHWFGAEKLNEVPVVVLEQKPGNYRANEKGSDCSIMGRGIPCTVI